MTTSWQAIEDMNKTILICTVGGSPEPIVTSIKTLKPDYVCFLCSGKDPATGSPGTESLIKGDVIKNDKTTQPNIPAQTKLRETQYDVTIIPTDSLDKAFTKIEKRILELTERYQDSRFIADYTGGTKSMSIALVTAALENENINCQVVTGARSSVDKVQPGMESAIPASVNAIRVRRAVNQAMAAWQRFAYGETANDLDNIITGMYNEELQPKAIRLKDLSKAFDAWDRFDHENADRLINTYSKQIALAPAHKHLLDAIKSLAGESECQEPARLLDLWLNALRRAEQGRFDDAVARLYRLLEWTAQWVLRKHCDIDTADIPKDKIPSDISMPPNEKGKYQAGLLKAWQLVEHLRPGSKLHPFSKEALSALKGKLSLRNASILAHGYQPISQQDWEGFRQWLEVESGFLEMLQQEAKAAAKDAGLRWSMPEQLPQKPWPQIEL